MKEKIFNIIQIGDKSNRISRAFDIFITFTIICNIIVTFLETFDQLTSFGGLFTMLEHASVLIFCIELRATHLDCRSISIQKKHRDAPGSCFLISFDWSGGSADDHPCLFSVGLHHFPYAARGADFPSVPAQCEI